MMFKKLLKLTVIVFATQVYSQDGTLDLSFGNQGRVLTSINNDINKAYGVVLQNDGKIVVAGYTYSSISGNDFVCIRYNQDGNLDTSFGNNGIATFDLQIGSDDVAYSIDIQTNGKLVLAGYSDDGSNKDGAVIRLNTDGTLDSSFGNSGKVFTNFSTSGNPNRQDEYKVVKIHHITGNIVVGGTSNITNADGKPIFARYTSNGDLDTSFGTSGRVINLPNPIQGWTFLFTIEDLAIKSNGKITAVGWVKPTTGANFYYSDHYECRLNSNGTLDTAFSGDGYDSDLFVTNDNKTYSILLNPDDSFYFGGHYLWNNNQTKTYIGVTNATGTATNDTAIEFWENIQPYCRAIAKDSSGRFLIGGTIFNASTNISNFLIIRLLSDLSIDTTFGSGGYTNTNFNNAVNEAYDMKVQTDGKILLVGFSGNNIALARYNPVTLSVNEVSKQQIKLYPNPAEDYIYIDSKDSLIETTKYNIIDINGRIVKSDYLNDNKINIQHLEKGMYFLKLNSNNATFKFIKK